MSSFVVTLSIVKLPTACALALYRLIGLPGANTPLADVSSITPEKYILNLGSPRNPLTVTLSLKLVALINLGSLLSDRVPELMFKAF